LVNGKQATRSGDLFHKQLVVDNTSDAQWFPLDVIAHDSVAGTYRKESGHQFLPLNPVEPKYDEDGNLTQDARWDYTWDGENRLIAMETLSTVVTAGVPQQKLEFAYDGQSRRIQKKVSIWTGSSWMPDQDTRFIWDGWNLIVELDGLNTYSAVNTYVWGLDLSGSMQGAGGVGGLLFAETATGSSIPAYDGNGNVLAYVDASNGVIEAEYEYGVFGETTKTESETADDFNFQFSTKYVDAETRLYYYGYRFYDPEVGRWISRDPIGEMGGLNLYGFVRNGPIDMIDFFGLKDYSPGDTDPPLASDPGSGIYNSVTPTFRYRVMEQTVRAAGLFSGMPNARKHLYHYLGNSGADLTIDFEDMLDTVPDERRLMMREADLARVYVETLADGKHTFTSRSKSIGNVRKDESEDWHYATAGYEYWGQGTVEISGEGKCFSMSFTYKMSDTYNWDAGKAVRFKIPKGSGWLVQSAVGTSGPVRRAPNNVLVVEDKAMAQLHLMGLAKEFVQYGEVQKKYTWTKGDARMTEVKDNIGTKNK
ncbi:MAG: RHS repeat-associated core domain-containing protein, partial [Opitutales bacterium]|nr:RHS repeat-associated core domain-containing protein [Opitutales bacterium]